MCPLVRDATYRGTTVPCISMSVISDFGFSTAVLTPFSSQLTCWLATRDFSGATTTAIGCDSGCNCLIMKMLQIILY